MAVVLAVVLVGAAATVVSMVGGESVDDLRRVAGLVGFVGGTLGFGFIGLLDDLVGATSTKGFKGHLGALRHGNVTTGLVKLVWGGAARCPGRSR